MSTDTPKPAPPPASLGIAQVDTALAALAARARRARLEGRHLAVEIATEEMDRLLETRLNLTKETR
ncbi:MAG: hypothetical protein ACYC1Z_03470 [Georgenia sp.]